MIPLMSKKADQHCLDLRLWHLWLLWLGGIVQTPLHGLAFGLGIILITPCFSTSYDTIQKTIFLKLFCEVHAQSETSVPLFHHQVSGHKLCCFLKPRSCTKIFLPPYQAWICDLTRPCWGMICLALMLCTNHLLWGKITLCMACI
jgi:hypothetical protein